MTTLEAWKRSVDERLRKVKQQEDYQAQALAALRPQLSVSTSYAPMVNAGADNTNPPPNGWYLFPTSITLKFAVESGSALVIISAGVTLRNWYTVIGYDIWDTTTGEEVVNVNIANGLVFDNRQSALTFAPYFSGVYMHNHKLIPGRRYGIELLVWIPTPASNSQVTFYDTLLTVRDLT